ncbi:MAG: hypothetical protein ABIQ30_14450 [Devosia sp.]
MPLYRFDTEVGGELLQDSGFVLDSDDEARDEAIRALGELAKELVPEKQAGIYIRVWRQDGALLLTLSVTCNAGTTSELWARP